MGFKNFIHILPYGAKHGDVLTLPQKICKYCSKSWHFIHYHLNPERLLLFYHNEWICTSKQYELAIKLYGLKNKSDGLNSLKILHGAFT